MCNSMFFHQNPPGLDDRNHWGVVAVWNYTYFVVRSLVDIQLKTNTVLSIPLELMLQNLFRSCMRIKVFLRMHMMLLGKLFLKVSIRIMNQDLLSLCFMCSGIQM